MLHNNTLNDIKFSDAELRPQDLEKLRAFPYYVGAFHKFGVIKDEMVFLIKMSPYISGETEYLCNQIAEEFKLPIAPYGKTNIDGKQCFLTLDFTSHLNGPYDLVHLAEFFTEEATFANWDCQTIMRLIETRSHEPDRDIETFMRTMLFDSLVGNNDRHSRNLAFIRTSNHEYLAPIYDNCSFIDLIPDELLGANFRAECIVETADSKGPMLEDYIKEFTKMGRRALVKKIANDIDTARIFTYIDEAGYSPERRLVFRNYVLKSMSALEALCKK